MTWQNERPIGLLTKYARPYVRPVHRQYSYIHLYSPKW